MSFLSWDPSSTSSGASLLLFQGPNPGCNTKPGEILALTTGSKVDLLDNIPPPAAQTNFGGSVTVLLGQTPYALSAVTYDFQLARTGWYETNIPYMTGLLSGQNDTYELDIVMIKIVGTDSTYLAATNRALLGEKAQTGASVKFYADDLGATYRIYIGMFGVNSASYTSPTLGATVSWDNIYIFPVVSAIDAAGSSPFVILP